MGWTYYCANYWKKGKIDRKRECDEMFSNEHYEVVKSQMVGTTYYGAIQHLDKGIVFGVVCLTKVDGNDFGYKDMDDTMGPYAYDCPRSILDLLSPTDNECANNWRQQCYANLERKKNSLAKLPIGSRIKVKMPYDTTYFHKGDEVVLIKMKRGYRSTYWVVQNGCCYFNRNLISSLERNCEIEILNGKA